MHYKKVETYSFSVPRDYNHYLRFRDELKESGVRFTEESQGMFQILTIRTTGTFDEEGNKK